MTPKRSPFLFTSTPKWPPINYWNEMVFSHEIIASLLQCLHSWVTFNISPWLMCLRFIMKWQQKLSVFSKQKRMTVEPENQHTEEDGLHEDGEAEEVSSTLSQPPELQDPTASSSTSTVRKWKKCLAFFGIFYSGLVRHFFKITIQLRSITITWLFTAINKSELWKA